ncbi:MAG: serine hydrolase domain-containing protein [Thermomicrobiales bacterium]
MYPAAYDAGRSRKNHDEFTFQNWSDGGEIMHYAFLHMSEFFTQAIIYRSGPISGLTSNPDKDIASLTVETHLGEMTIDDYVEQGPVDGVVIVRSGEVVYERYPRMRPFDKHLLMSVSKIFVSTVIGILEDEGKVDSSAPIDRYLPELSGSGWEGVSVRDILDMASGIDCLESDEPGAYSDPSTAYYQYEASLGWLAPTPETMESTYAYLATLGRRREPGEAFEYTSPNTFVLSWLAERVTGQLFNEIVTDKLWSRIGAESDALVSTSRVGAPASHGGISATVRDVARLGLLFTPSWNVVADESIISATHMRRIQEEGRPEIFDKAGAGQSTIASLRGERPRFNSWQWDFVTDDGDFYKGGFGGQGLYISPSRDLVVAYTGIPGLDKQGNELKWVARQLSTSGIL